MDNSGKCIWTVYGQNWSVNVPGFITDSPITIAKPVLNALFIDKKDSFVKYFNLIEEEPILSDNVFVSNDMFPEDDAIIISAKKILKGPKNGRSKS